MDLRHLAALPALGVAAMVLEDQRRIADAERRERLRAEATANAMSAVALQPESRQVRRARERRERAS